jgi:hypothetical protein
MKQGTVFAALALSLILGITAAAQQPQLPSGFNERKVDREPTPEDRQGIWVLNFHFKDPRVVMVDVPGKGRKPVWYLWYQVSNDTGAPRMFIPTFVWVCHDVNTVHADSVIPSVQRAIAKVEDADNILNIRNSVTIAQQPIPVSKEFDDQTKQRIAFPKMITGVAMWDNIDPRSTQFSIFVFGLSDGFTEVDDVDGKKIVRRKALQLKFRRVGDDKTQHSNQIRFVSHEWVYATSDQPVPIINDPPRVPDDVAPRKKP